MSRVQLAIVVVLGTFAFTLIFAGGLSLAESEKRERMLRASALDPSGGAEFLLTVARILIYSLEWKVENRLGLSLFWSGIAGGVIVLVLAFLA